MTHEEALRKAIACLKLSKSPNEAEAALAAAKAQEIIDRYKLDVTSVDFEQQEKQRDDEPIMDFGNDPLETVPNMQRRWAVNLSSYVTRVNQCRLYYANTYSSGAVLKVVGRPSDVATVRYVYAWLKREVERLRDANTLGQSKTYKYHYCLGVVDTIGRKLREQQRATQQTVTSEHGGNPMALMLVKNSIVRMEQRAQAVEKWMESNLKLGKGRASEQRTSTGGRAHGQRDGNQVRFNAAKTGLNNSSNKQLSPSR